MGDLPEIAVLLSVFRGGGYIAEQVASLAAQEDVRVRLVYHMDEEDPGTEQLILGVFPTAWRAPIGPGQGLPHAYLGLIQIAGASDYFAFCDQDDIWHPRKLITAVRSLDKARDEPTLWLCRVQLFGDVPAREVPAIAYPRKIPHPSFGNALVENIGPGCAMVWNSRLHHLLRREVDRDAITMHDAWLYLVATALGQVLVEPDVFVRYRLHSSNAVGIRKSPIARLRRLLQSRLAPRGPSLPTQTEALMRAYASKLDEDKFRVAAALAFGGSLERYRLAANGCVVRQGKHDNRLLGLRLLFGWGKKVKAEPTVNVNRQRRNAGRT